MGCELIGISNPEAIAELIALAYYALKETGLKGIILRIGNLDYLDQQMEKILQTDTDISKYHPGGAAEWKSDMSRFIDKEDYEGIQNQLRKIDANPKDVKEFNEFLKSGSVSDLKTFIETSKLEIYEKVIRHLKEFGIDQIKIEMKIARGLDYYKGLVFEIDAPVLGAEKQICGGGVYDLVKSFGGKDVPTAGFAIGFDRTILALDAEQFSFPLPKTDVYIIPVNSEMIEKSIEIAQQLRKEGVITEFDLLHRGVGKSLKYANSKNSEKAIIIGPRELEKDSVTLRDMKTGDQQLIKIAEILSKIKNH